jgi:hypothetical protein
MKLHATIIAKDDVSEMYTHICESVIITNNWIILLDHSGAAIVRYSLRDFLITITPNHGA